MDNELGCGWSAAFLVGWRECWKKIRCMFLLARAYDKYEGNRPPVSFIGERLDSNDHTGQRRPWDIHRGVVGEKVGSRVSATSGESGEITGGGHPLGHSYGCKASSEGVTKIGRSSLIRIRASQGKLKDHRGCPCKGKSVKLTHKRGNTPPE